MYYRFSDMANILTLAFNPGKRQKAFDARIKHLKRPNVGCIPGVKQSGQGVSVHYTLSDLRHLFLALFLNNSIGLDPKVIGQIYRDDGFNVDEWFEKGIEKLGWDIDKFDLGPLMSQRGGHDPYYVMFRLTDEFTKGGYYIPFTIQAEGPEFLTGDLIGNPNGTLLDFTFLAAWLKLAIEKWDKQMQQEEK